MYDITTGTGDFIANGVVSHNCFARPTHTYLDFERRPRLREGDRRQGQRARGAAGELARPSWKGEHVAMGTNTDPYQWVEGRYKLMRGIWEALRDCGQPVLGADEVAAAAARPATHEGDRAVTDDQREPVGADASTRRRGGRASRTRRNPRRGSRRWRSSTGGHPDGRSCRAADAGHQRRPAQVEEILELAARPARRASSGIALHLRGEVRGIFMEWLRSYRPDLVERYEELYARSAYAPRASRSACRALVRRAPARRRRLPARSRGDDPCGRGHAARAAQRASREQAPRAHGRRSRRRSSEPPPPPAGHCDQRHGRRDTDRARWCCPCL
jgi:hypothetical protein